MQILILGMHRSGTSMTARLINMMGAYFGPEHSGIPPKEENPKGFWERREVVAINEELLKSKGCTWSDLRQWSFEDAPLAPDNILINIKHFIFGVDSFRPWMIKDPRLCLLLPAWLPYLESPAAVIVHRNPFEIALSLQRRNNFPIEYSLALWEHYVVGMLNSTLHIPRIFVRYVDLHEKPIRTCEHLHMQLQSIGVRRLLAPSANEIRAFVDPMLYRSKYFTPLDVDLTMPQKILAEMMRGVRLQEGELSVSEQSRTIIRNFISETIP